MGHTSLRGGGVSDRHRSIDGTNSVPKHAHGKFGVEVEAAGGGDRVHDGNGWGERIEAKPKERILNASAEGFEVGKAIANPTTADAFGWGVGAEDRHAKKHGLRRFP